jgi:tetratricopeptide (TPR) repeat protein
MKKLYNITLFFVLLFSASAVFAQSELENGIESYNQGEYQKASETLEKIVQADEKNRKAWLYLGMSYARLKNNSKAAKALKKADKIPDKETDPDPINTRAKIISKPRATYTDAARANMTQGTIKLAVEFGADGKIKAVVAFRTLPDGLTENCVAAAKGIRFEPAKKDGKPVTSIKIVEYTFTIY